MRLLLVFGLFIMMNPILGSDIVFPGNEWQEVKDVSKHGFNPDKLAEAEKYSKTIDTAAVMVIKDGYLISQWGDTKRKYLTHSTRKSFLSALYGKYVESGVIDLDSTMEDLKIDDINKLSKEEKQATVRDALKARTGIYHTAEAENDWMHGKKPERGSYRPGEFWVYNNWDFNVLGTIFEQQTKQTVYEALKNDLADPIGMQDYSIDDELPIDQGRSKYQAYMFVISARDMARFGLLFLNNGKWKDKQVVPAKWVKESTRYHSDATYYRQDGYGYMWWTARNTNKFPHIYNATVPDGSYSAKGAGGHYIVVIPEMGLVVVHRVDTFARKDVRENDFGRLLQKILDAQV